MSDRPQDQVPLTPLTMALLLSLAEGERHGYALMKDVDEQTEGTLTPGTGSLYAALERLMDEGLIEEAPDAADGHDDRRRRYYRITEEGRAVTRAEAKRMLRVLTVARDRDLAPELVPAPREGT